MASISWTETAQNDLAEIHKYIRKHSLAQAELVVVKIIEKTETLERFPEMGKPVKKFPDKQYRELLIKGYRVI